MSVPELEDKCQQIKLECLKLKKEGDIEGAKNLLRKIKEMQQLLEQKKQVVKN